MEEAKLLGDQLAHVFSFQFTETPWDLRQDAGMLVSSVPGEFWSFW